MVLAVALTVGCEGENLFRENPVGPGGNPGGGSEVVRDSVAPAAPAIALPLPEAIVAAGEPLLVRVAVEDDVALDSVVVQGVADASGVTRFERASKRYAAADTVRSDTVSLTLAPKGTGPAEKASVVVKAFDRSGNAREATVQFSLADIRGTLIPLEHDSDRIADMVSDGERVFLSNFSRNRVEVLPIGGDQFRSFRVGSQPWGLALSPDRGTLYVANSGGTNISVVDLGPDLPTEDESRRIFTPNIKLFLVPFQDVKVPALDAGGQPVLTATGDTVMVDSIAPVSVTVHDYSDRPQFIGAMTGGSLIYSTKPTGSAPDGTIREVELASGKVGIFTDYISDEKGGQVVVIDADSVRPTKGDRKKLVVWPRPSPSPGFAIVGYIEEVKARLEAGGFDTRIQYYLNLDELGLTDTTFVAVSGDHRTVAFGEGGRDPGRVILFERGADGEGFTRAGEVGDLVGNASERVIGLSLNQDGSLGAARGEQAYFFTDDLRLQGVVTTGGEPSGGITMAPGQSGYPTGPESERFAFVSGVDENGTPYVDVVDNFNFFRVQRVFLRERIVGPVVAVRPGSAPDSLRLYGLTRSGVIEVTLSAEDLRP